MRSFWSDPYLWIHISGLAALPLFLELCLLGLAVGSPLFPVWVEVLLVGILGAVPVLWMQWFRPFYIFSILVVALRPSKLTPLQQKLLSRFKTPLNRVFTVVVTFTLAVILWQLYRIAPLAADGAPFPPQWRVAGLLLASLAFLASNLFLQVPVSVLGVLLTGETELAATPSYALEKIPQDFTILGWQLNRILPWKALETMESEVSQPPPVSATSDAEVKAPLSD